MGDKKVSLVEADVLDQLEPCREPAAAGGVKRYSYRVVAVGLVREVSS